MSLELTVFSADYLVGDKPYCRYDIFAELSNAAVEFIENSISLAEQKKGVVQIVLTENEIRTEILLPHGVFLKSISQLFANLILISNDILIIPLSEQNTFQFKIDFNFNLKSTE